MFSEYLDEAFKNVKTDMVEEKDDEAHTLEDVKNALKTCAYSGMCSRCPYKNDCDNHIANGGDERPADTLLLDALFYIGELESERDELLQKNQQLERERDAAVEDMTELMQLAQFCRHCKHITTDGECTFDFAANKGELLCWQWRGVQEVE